MAEVSNNPAGRLKALVDAAYNVDPNWLIADVWREVLGIPPEDPAELWRQVANIYSLPGEIRERMEAAGISDDDRAFTLRHLPEVENAMFQVAWQAHPFVEFRSRVSDTAIFSLELADRILRAQSPETPMSEGQLEEIRALVANLIAETVEADSLDPELRSFMLEHLEAVERALREVRIRGTEAVAEAAARVYGERVFRPDLDGKVTEKDKKTWDNFWKVMNRVVLSLNLLISITALPANIATTRALLKGAQPAVTAPASDGSKVLPPATPKS